MNVQTTRHRLSHFGSTNVAKNQDLYFLFGIQANKKHLLVPLG